MKRRSFLRHTFHSLAVPGVLGSMGFAMPSAQRMEELLRMASDSDRALVMIFLEGGNDGLNTVIPLDGLSKLNRLRPHVILPDSDLLHLNDSSSAFHPAMSEMKRLYDEDRLMVFQNVGYPEQNFSHFRSTDIWMSGSDSDTYVNTGWAGRQLETDFPGYPHDYPNEQMEDPLSVEIGYGSSLLFQGVSSSLSVTINSVDSFYQLVDNLEQEAPDSPAGDKLKFIRLIAQQSQSFGKRIVDVASKVNNHVPYPGTYLADQLKVVSKLIAGGSRTPLYLVRLGGFDTHDQQVEENDHLTGEHANLLSTLDGAISAFMKDLELHGVGDKVLGMTFSEFGRRIVSNASLGTDHGAAAPMFFFGNKVKGGMVGANPTLDSAMNYRDNLPHEFDFRQLYGSVLEQWFGIDAPSRSAVLLNDFGTMEVIGEKIPPLALNTDHTLKVYPNPLSGSVTISFQSSGEDTSIELVDLQGRRVSSIYAGRPAAGRSEVNWNTDQLAAGRYFVLKKTSIRSEVFNVWKR